MIGAVEPSIQSEEVDSIGVKDEHKVGAIEGLLAEAVADVELAEQARNNSKVDFVNSPALQVVLEDAIWSQETASAEVLAAVRNLPPRQLIQLAMDFGLYERLRERPTG